MRRSLPNDPMKPVPFGWCYRRPLIVPSHCSWCGLAVTVTKRGAVLCPDCDAPAPNPEWEADLTV